MINARPAKPRHQRPPGPVVFVTDVRMMLRDDGSIAATHTAGAGDAWMPYLDAFGELSLLARQVDETGRFSPLPISHAERITLFPLRDYSGLGQFLVRLAANLARAWRAVRASRLVIIRAPELMSVAAGVLAAVARTPFVVNLVADPAVFFPGKTKRAKLAAKAFSRLHAWLIKRSAGTIYVTQEYLQQKFPPPRSAPTIARSNVIITHVASPRRWTVPPSPLRIVSVGTLNADFKGQDTIIEAAALLHEEGIPVTVTLVGSGQFEKVYAELADRLEVGHLVTFAGQLDRPQVQTALAEADLFVMASRSEGLPRALVEGMAAGLPAIGSGAGGIPELLAPEDVVDPCTPAALVERISKALSDSSWFNDASIRNVESAAWIQSSADPKKLTRFLRDVDQTGSSQNRVGDREENSGRVGRGEGALGL